MAALGLVACGLALSAVGCGPNAGPSGKTEPSKQDTSKTTPAAKPNGTEAPKGAGDAAKSAEDEVNKRLGPIQKAYDALKAKVLTAKKEAGSDAAKLTAAHQLENVQDDAGRKLSDVQGKVKGFRDLKDAAAVEAAKKSALETVDKLEKELADHLPK